jgi:uncharacterized protein YjbJ (UPF0337 family)
MNKERVKGAIDEVVGSVRRMVGDSTGDLEGEVNGTVQQLKGEAEIAEGKLKDAAQDLHDRVVASNDSDKDAQREKREVLLAENHILL